MTILELRKTKEKSLQDPAWKGFEVRKCCPFEGSVETNWNFCAGILRRKSTENATEMKGILRSKSPSTGAVSSEQPKSILKRHSPDVDESEQLSGSSSSSEDLVVPAENDLAAQLLNVELEAKNHQPAFGQLPGDVRNNTATNEAELSAPLSTEEASTTAETQQHQKEDRNQSIAAQARRET